MRVPIEPNYPCELHCVGSSNYVGNGLVCNALLRSTVVSLRNTYEVEKRKRQKVESEVIG